MNNWSSRTLPLSSGHQRSVSVVGYQDILNSDADPPKYDQSWLNRYKGNGYGSSMDINKMKPDSNDTKKFVWRSPKQIPSSYSVSNYGDCSNYSQNQRPFETAFKSAIIKMKESGLSRLGAVDKNLSTPYVTSTPSNVDLNELYKRNCQTLQPIRKNNTNSYMNESRKHVFRFEPSLEKSTSGILNLQNISKNLVSNTDLERNINMTNHCKSELNLNQDHRNSLISTISTKSSNEKVEKSGASVIIPVRNNKIHNICEEKNSVKTEAFISPVFAKNAQSSSPQIMENDINNIDEDISFESLPSVKEIISKVESRSNQPDQNIMSKSLTLTHEKPPIILNQRVGSQRILDNFQNPTSSTESPSLSQKRLSGLYKKNTTTTPKIKSVSNMPGDFQKLHLAFLDQKQEIQRLRQQLIERNAVITQLEADLRNYEPWR